MVYGDYREGDNIMTPTQLVALIKKSHLSRNMDAISIINVIYKVTDYSNQSPIGKDEINNKIAKYYKL